MGRKSIADIRRKEIVEAFFKVVAEKGLAKATIREVAEVAGCSQGMLHHYFTNKEEMILEVLDYVTTAYTIDYQKGISTFDTATERMRFFITWFVDLDKFDIDWTRILMEFRVFAKANSTVAQALRRFYKMGEQDAARIIRDGIKRKEFRKVNPSLSANLILGSIEGTISLWLLDPKPASLKAMGKQMAELYLEYLKID